MSKKKKTEDNTRLESIRTLEDIDKEEKLEKGEWEADKIDDEEENTDQKGFDRTVN